MSHLKQDTSIFDSAYANLNERQKMAVDAIEGPVMVVAGPGTGKTQILTLRIANILRLTDTSPDALLAITFTESAAATMRARLVAIIGNTGYKVAITTFHSFCNALIQKYPEEFSRIIGSQQITDIDQLRILSDIVTEGSYEILKPHGDPLFYVKAIQAGIHTLKREGVNPTAYQALTQEEEQRFLRRTDTHHTGGPHQGKMKGIYIDELKQIRKNKEIADIYNAYQEMLFKDRWYDFDDMIMEVISAFERSEDFLRSIQERYQYILIDEHQDTNNAQNKIIERLCNFDTRPNVFLVGDEKQAIFRFQGASFENFMRIKEKFPDTQIVVLEENYRSSQYILNASHTISERMVKDPQALIARAARKNAPIHIATYYDGEQEIRGVTSHIHAHIEQGIAPHEIAVLYRDNKDAYSIARIFERENIPYVIESDQDALSDPLVKAFINIIRAVDDPSNEERVVSLLHTECIGMHPLDIFLLMKRAREERKSITAVLRNIEQGGESTEFENIESTRQLYRNIVRWVRASHNTSPLACIDMLTKESNLMSYGVATVERIESLYKLKRVYKELERVIEQKPSSSFHDLVIHLESIAQHNVPIRTGSTRPSLGRVRLMTAHRSKGLEFDYVYIIHAHDGHWGNKRMPNILPLLPQIYTVGLIQTPEIIKEDEDRRLFYVALTRARKEVYISYAQYDTMARQQLPCAYIEDIRENISVREEIPYQEIKETLEVKKKQLITPTRERIQSMVCELLSERGLSVTAINNYLLCPWKYFYNNLLTIPQTQKKHQIYGTAIHAALRDVVLRVQKQGIQKDDAAYTVTQFQKHLRKKPLTQQEYEDLVKRGEKSVSEYVKKTEEQWKFPASTEFKISGVFITPDVMLRGVIDRMELLSDGGMVRVIDYKTGKHKSRTDIEGKTKSSTGDIYRQLIFYKLLLDAQEDKKYKMESGVIDFVEPNEKGDIRREEFRIEESEILALKDTIHTILGEIKELTFWDMRCGDVECEYCALRNMITEV
ncbi:MAG: ATP-dependent DNA helicase [Candidatus Paceibacterota bacterium]